MAIIRVVPSPSPDGPSSTSQHPSQQSQHPNRSVSQKRLEKSQGDKPGSQSSLSLRSTVAQSSTMSSPVSQRPTAKQSLQPSVNEHTRGNNEKTTLRSSLFHRSRNTPGGWKTMDFECLGVEDDESASLRDSTHNNSMNNMHPSTNKAEHRYYMEQAPQFDVALEAARETGKHKIHYIKATTVANSQPKNVEKSFPNEKLEDQPLSTSCIINNNKLPPRSPFPVKHSPTTKRITSTASASPPFKSKSVRSPKADAIKAKEDIQPRTHRSDSAHLVPPTPTTPQRQNSSFLALQQRRSRPPSAALPFGGGGGESPSPRKYKSVTSSGSTSPNASNTSGLSSTAPNKKNRPKSSLLVDPPITPGNQSHDPVSIFGTIELNNAIFESNNRVVLEKDNNPLPRRRPRPDINKDVGDDHPLRGEIQNGDTEDKGHLPGGSRRILRSRSFPHQPIQNAVNEEPVEASESHKTPPNDTGRLKRRTRSSSVHSTRVHGPRQPQKHQQQQQQPSEHQQLQKRGHNTRSPALSRRDRSHSLPRSAPTRSHSSTNGSKRSHRRIVDEQHQHDHQKTSQTSPIVTSRLHPPDRSSSIASNLTRRRSKSPGVFSRPKQDSDAKNRLPSIPMTERFLKSAPSGMALE